MPRFFRSGVEREVLGFPCFVLFLEKVPKSRELGSPLVMAFYESVRRALGRLKSFRQSVVLAYRLPAHTCCCATRLCTLHFVQGDNSSFPTFMLAFFLVERFLEQNFMLCFPKTKQTGCSVIPSRQVAIYLTTPIRFLRRCAVQKTHCKEKHPTVLRQQTEGAFL